MLILKTLKELGSDKFNIVTWNDSFTFGGRFCLEFEKLDISLLKFLQRRRFQPLSLMEIRPIVQQVSVCSVAYHCYVKCYILIFLQISLFLK